MYNVSSFGLRVSFSATFNQKAERAHFVGHITDYVVEQSEKWEAIVTGKTDGDEVTFTKHYTNITGDPVQYRGTLEKDVIRGSWLIEGLGGETNTGTFEMWRMGIVDMQQSEQTSVDELLRRLDLANLSEEPEELVELDKANTKRKGFCFPNPFKR